MLHAISVILAVTPRPLHHPTRRRLASAPPRTVVALAVGGLVLVAARRASGGGTDHGTVDINLVTVNDFHGRIEQTGTAGRYRRACRRP